MDPRAKPEDDDVCIAPYPNTGTSNVAEYSGPPAPASPLSADASRDDASPTSHTVSRQTMSSSLSSSPHGGWSAGVGHAGALVCFPN